MKDDVMGGKGSGRKPSPCGTPAKYGWHRRRGEHCQLCCDAKTEYYRLRGGYKKRQPRRETTAQKKERINALMLEVKLAHGQCCDCGLLCVVDNWFVFDWDHRDPSQKLFTIGDKKHSVSTEKLLAEIAKCDLVCANCHRYRTHGQLKSGKISPYNHSSADIPSLFDLL